MSDFISRQNLLEHIKNIPYVQEHPNIGLLFAEWIKSFPEADDGWIPTDEALPTTSDKVLTTKQYSFGIYVEDDKYFNRHWIGKTEGNCKTLAWMPYPEPYKPKEDKS